MLRLLVRSATGGELTQYTTFHCGPKRPGDADGPEEMHIVLVDNGRTRMLANGLTRDAALHPLRRLHEPLRRLPPDRRPRLWRASIPGRWGPCSPRSSTGLAKSRDLPHACTMNGRCQEVCPVDIPLPTLLRGWRDRSWREGLEPAATRYGIGLWAFVARRPALYRLGERASACGRCGCSARAAGSARCRSPAAGRRTAICRRRPARPSWSCIGRERRVRPGSRARCPDGSARTASSPLSGPGSAAPGATPAAIAAEAAALLASPELIRPRLPELEPGRAVRRARRGAQARHHAGAGREPEPSCPRPCGATSPRTACRPLSPSSPRPSCMALDWQGIEARTAMAPDEAVGVGLARWGIAETGSLVFHSGPDTPILLAFLPLHHIVAVRAGSILAHLEDYAAAGSADRTGAAQRHPDHRSERDDGHRGQLRPRRARAGLPARRSPRGPAMTEQTKKALDDLAAGR